MDYSHIREGLYLRVDEAEVARKVAEATAEAEENMNGEVYKFCLSVLDLTTLGYSDSAESVAKFAAKAAAFTGNFPLLPSPASVCVYPLYVDVAGIALEGSDIGVTSVGGGFPSSQTFLEVKMLECAMAEESGADEIDIVMNAGLFLEGNLNTLASEIEMIRGELDKETILKVIIESGAMPSLSEVREASLVAMAAGADFIKTSTGKNCTGATPEAFLVMCEAARDFYLKTGKKTGVKVAGGVKTGKNAVLYYTIIKKILGPEWLSSELFRIGASSLANDLASLATNSVITYY